MKVSMKTDYGVRALIDLAQHYGQGLIQSSEIAGRQFVPEAFLDQVLTSLRKAGFIRSVRGPQGGHALARPPEEITLGEVIVAMEGPLVPTECLISANSCRLSRSCAQQEVWLEVMEATNRILDGTVLGDLARRQESLESRAMYHI